ncbi:MAG: hypothetical protein RLZZ519_1413 [Bacteroidota bacterium]|jgi:hypothetical protein
MSLKVRVGGLPGVASYQIEVFDATGKRMLGQTAMTETLSIDCYSFPAGFYFLRAYNESEVHFVRFLKQ